MGFAVVHHISTFILHFMLHFFFNSLKCSLGTVWFLSSQNAASITVELVGTHFSLWVHVLANNDLLSVYLPVGYPPKSSWGDKNESWALGGCSNCYCNCWPNFVYKCITKNKSCKTRSLLGYFLKFFHTIKEMPSKVI